MSNKALKLTSMGWCLALLACLFVYGLQTEKVIRNDFALQNIKAEYQSIMQAKASLNTKALKAAGFKELEKKIKELGYVPVAKISYITVPYNVLALRNK